MKYEKKVTQIANILQAEVIKFQDPEDELCLSYYDVYMEKNQAKNIAEKILAKVGIHRPNNKNSLTKNKRP